MTVPVAFRKKLGLKPGEQVFVEIRGEEVIVRKNNWRENLRLVQAESQAHMKKHGIKPLTDEELDIAINQAAQQAATRRYQRSLEK